MKKILFGFLFLAGFAVAQVPIRIELLSGFAAEMETGSTVIYSLEGSLEAVCSPIDGEAYQDCGKATYRVFRVPASDSKPQGIRFQARLIQEAK